MSFIYLASPYTPTEGESIEQRVEKAQRYAAKLMLDGFVVFSPVAHSHHIADHMDEALRLDHEFWMKQSLAFVRSARKMVVLKLDGWERSRGIAREVEVAKAICIPVEYHDYAVERHYPEEWTDKAGQKRLTCICGHADPFHQRAAS